MNARIERTAFATALSLVFVLTFLAYYPGLSGDFAFDDFPSILQNSNLNIHSLNTDELLSASLSSGSGPLRRPVSMLSFALNRYAFGPGPYSFKLTNVAIHLVTGALLFVFTLFLLKGYRELHARQLSDAALRWLALTVAAAWMLHPLNLTSVLYIVQRMTSLAALFSVAALCVYAYGRLRMLKGKSGLLLILIVVPIFGALSVLSKESGILLPLYICVVEVCIFRFRITAGGKVDRRLAVLYAGSFAIVLLIALAWLLPHPERILAGYEGRGFTLAERLLTEVRVVLLYLKWIIYPNIHELGLYHDDIAVSTDFFAPPVTALALLGISGLIGIAIWQYNRRPLITLGIAWFFVGHALESTVIPLELAHEHRNYLPDYGIVLAIASLIPLPDRATKWTRSCYTITLSTLLLLAAVTWLRAGQWADNVSHAQYEARHHPTSPRAVFALGRIYANLAIAGYMRDPDKALDVLERASVLDTHGIMPDASLILAASKLSRQVDPSWLTRVQSKLGDGPLSPSDINALHELSGCAQEICPISHQQIIELFKSAGATAHLSENPCQRADLLTIQANYLTSQGDNLREPLAVMTLASRLCPQEPQYRINLVRISLVLGRKKQAGSEIQKLQDMNLFGRLNQDIAALKYQLGQATD